MAFQNRTHAGQVLAEKLSHYRHNHDVVVLALPRGGVPVAFEVAKALDAPLDVFLVRKLGVPGHEELAMGAIASGGVSVLNDDVIGQLRISASTIAAVALEEQAELDRRERQYRGDRPPPDVQDKIVILVDDGLATGSTMRAAARALRKKHPERLVVAVPVGAAETCREFEREVDETVCAVTPDPFYAVGAWYDVFDQTSDREVESLLAEAARLSSPVR